MYKEEGDRRLKEFNLQCINCKTVYSRQEVEYTCPKCGDAAGILEIIYDYAHILKKLSRGSFLANTDFSVWRYADLLPVEKDLPFQRLRVGWTPLYKAERLGKQLGLNNLYVKDDGINPTSSFKDRASIIGVAMAVKKNKDTISCASTGNAASSLAGAAACAGLKSYIFVPATAPIAKITQLLIYGANVFLVDGSYDQAYDLCSQAVAEYGWYNRNCAVNPYLIEGKKTAGLEICEQFGWDVPDRVFMSVGDGCSIAGVWKGFKEMKNIGVTDKTPEMVGVQAEGSKHLVEAFLEGTENIPYYPPSTIADSISVGVPRNGIKALRAVRESGGTMLTVSDNEIIDAMKVLARTTGVFGEPAAAAAMAGLIKMAAQGELDPDEKIVVCITGNGLKDIASAQKATGQAIKIKPELRDLQMVIKEQGL